jgi:hypothetical protein
MHYKIRNFMFLCCMATVLGGGAGGAGIEWLVEMYAKVRKNPPLFAMPFIYKNDHFAKTGSGQT